MMWSRSLARYVVSIGALLALIVAVAPARAQQNNPEIDKALAYMRTQQQPDGSFTGFGPGSTADAVYALAAANVKVTDVAQGGKSSIDYIRSQAKGAGKDTGLAAKFLIAILVAGQSPATADADLVAEVEQGYNAQTGQYGKDVTAHAYALIGLVAAGRTPKPEAVDALKKLQLPDGGWSFDGTAATGSDTNTTSLAVQALKAVNDSSDAVSKAIAYYRAQQNADGGFPYSQTSQFGNASDANSTALSLQALIAAGEDVSKWARDNNATPATRLAAFQNPSGAFRYQDKQPEDNAGATYQAVPALLGKTLPLAVITGVQPAPAESPAPSAAPSGSPVASPTPVKSPAPRPTAAPAGGVPRALPNTGVVDLLPIAALLGLLLIATGWTINRRRV